MDRQAWKTGYSSFIAAYLVFANEHANALQIDDDGFFADEDRAWIWHGNLQMRPVSAMALQIAIWRWCCRHHRQPSLSLGIIGVQAVFCQRTADQWVEHAQVAVWYAQLDHKPVLVHL